MRNLHLFQAQPATVAALLPDFGLRAAAPARAVALRATHVAAGMKQTHLSVVGHPWNEVGIQSVIFHGDLMEIIMEHP